jgi:hypothetical protein
MKHLVNWFGFALALVSTLNGQQVADEPQRMTLTNLKTFAVHSNIQISKRATLAELDEDVLRTKIESAMQREGIVVQGADDVRDGSAAQVSLLYLVVQMRDTAGNQFGFAASSCLHVSQMVRIPRLSVRGRITYTVAPTWSSCGIVVGDSASYKNRILQNADEQIARWLVAWRAVNKSPPRPPPAYANPQLGISRR